MIAKILQSGYNDSGNFPAAAIIPSFSGGLDRQSLHKQASIFEKEYDQFERKPGHTYIHLISCAAGEFYGPNSRADFYNGDSYRHDFPHPEKGGPTFVILDGGLNKYHNKTFMEEGGVYTEHFSSRDGAKPQGYIVAAKMNPDMHRGELIIGVRTNEWADDIEKLSNGSPLKFSIGLDTNKDQCSYCGHVAHTEAQHCDHYKNNRGMITDDGSQIYVITDQGVFHDISRVRNPAEKIAFSIKKIARADDFSLWQPGRIKPESAKYLLKTATGLRRFNTLDKLAKIEKEILAVANSGSLDKNIERFFKSRKHTKRASEEDSGELLNKFLDHVNQDQLFNGLRENKKILTPGEFTIVAVPENYRKGGYGVDIDEIESLLPGIFNKILHRDDVDEFCEDETYECDTQCPKIVIDQLGRVPCGCSLDVNDLMRSVINAEDVDLTPTKRTVIIEISKPVTNVNELIADDYASYVVSAADRLSPTELAMNILNYIL